MPEARLARTRGTGFAHRVGCGQPPGGSRYARPVSPRDVQALIAELSDWAAAQGRPPQTHRYGSDPEHVADLLMPAADRRRSDRVAVLLHGGFWRARFTRATMAALAVDLADRGWATWNVEYRRVGSGGGVPETVDDVRAAIDALTNLDAALDRSQVVVIGHSAGGQLALCTAGMPGVAGVVSLAGVCDLGSGARERIGDSAVLEFLGGTPRERSEAYAIADPTRLLPTGVKVLLVHGDADDRVPVQQSRGYAQAARAVGDRCELLELPGVDHFAVIDPRTQVWAGIAEHLDALLA